MIYYKCKCGKSEAWGELPRCTKCSDCGSDLASGPNQHKEPLPHDYKETKVETDGEPAVLTRCMWCLRTKKQIEGVK